MASTREVIGAQLNFVKDHAAAVYSTVATSAKPGLAAGLGFVKLQAAAVASSRRDVGAVGTAAMVVGGAVATYFLWPAAVAAPAAAAATMKAPGAAGFLISRVAFQANPQLYYQILRTAGAAAAAAAFGVPVFV